MTMNLLWEEMTILFPKNSRTLGLLEEIPGFPVCMMAETLLVYSSLDQGTETPDLESLLNSLELSLPGPGLQTHPTSCL